MSSGTFPNYYDLLHIPFNASTDEVRTAYKKESLRTHPDRLGNASVELKKQATEKFQAVADAYYVLSDPSRRKEYDALYSSRKEYSSADPGASANFFSEFANMFTGSSAPAGDPDAPSPPGPGSRPDPDSVFGNVFEELLRPEVERRMPWWTYLGAASGAGLGFIIANIPGLLMGGYAGNRIGAIRDAKGKPVAVVFTQLAGNQKAEILKALAMKVLGSAF